VERATVRRMQDELWGYFGLAVIAGGAYPTLTLTPASGGNARAEGAALAQIGGDRGSWLTGRGRMEAFIRGAGLMGGNQTVRVSLQAFNDPGTLVGWNTLTDSDPQSGWGRRILINPFTWFYADGTPSMRFTSERARATYSATVLLLHELTHLWGQMFGTAPDHQTDSQREQAAVFDADRTMTSHRGVGLRRTYRHGHEGMRAYVDSEVADQEFSVPVRANSDYVEFPNETELQTGRRAR
jgi:hypothetical protein